MGIEEQKQSESDSDGTKGDGLCSTVDNQKLNTLHTLRTSTDSEADLYLCRVCHCAESDRRGDAAIGFLNILPPSLETSIIKLNGYSTYNISKEDTEKSVIHSSDLRESGFVEFVGPEGEIFVCSADIESGSYCQPDALFSLGCSCKNELSLVHYACALKWFISRGSTTCEICGTVASNMRTSDFKKVMASLMEYETLRVRTATGQVTQETVNNSANIPTENVLTVENPTTKWAVEGTGILVATGLLTVTLAWLIAPHVGKKTARNGLHILLGGICALTVVIFLRFVILSRIKYGPARYWAILFVFWFLVFGIWASRTHGHQDSGGYKEEEDQRRGIGLHKSLGRRAERSIKEEQSAVV